MLNTDNLVISLFSGAGGCSLGFSTAGLKPEIAADIDKDACATYSENLGVACDPLDLSTDASVAQILDRVGECRPFILVGGPPCQGFSTAGPRNAGDPRNRLIFNYLELVSRLQPKWFLFENVEGLLTSNRGRDVVRLAAEFRRLGYSFRLEKINFAGYGLAQTRKRVIIVGNRMGHYFSLPAPRFSFDRGKAKSLRFGPRAPTVIDAIGDLPEPLSSDGLVGYDQQSVPSVYAAGLRSKTGEVSHHTAVRRSDISELARHLLPGQTMKDLPEDMQHESYHRRANRRVRDGMPTEKRGGAPAGFKRLDGKLNSLTITGSASREFIHPVADRTLSLRECARLQSFPDDFRFYGKNASVARQIGNAIPPLGACVLAEAILKEDGRAGSDRSGCAGRAVGLIGFHLTDASGMSPALAETATSLQALSDLDNGSSLLRMAHA